MAVETEVADDCCEATEYGRVVLRRVECLDCREGWTGDGRKHRADGIVKVCFACVGENGPLICDVSAY